MKERLPEDYITCNEQLVSEINNGFVTALDGVMSPQTRELVDFFEACGVDMTTLWALTPQAWECPVCKRGKKSIVRLNKNNDLSCRLVAHHDHMQELLKKRFEEISSSLTAVVADQNSESFAKRAAAMVSSFDATVICDDCNIADVKAKKVSGAHRWFSFSPKELSDIIISESHSTHRINDAVAKKHWEDNKKTFNLRLRVLDRIAEIAATDAHWFQPVNFSNKPEIIEKNAQDTMGRYGAGDITALLLEGQRKREGVKDISQWRKKRYLSPNLLPTEGQIQHVAKVKAANLWNELESDWLCPCCHRSKIDIIKITNKKVWNFSLATRFYRDVEVIGTRKVKKHTLCSDCGFVSEGLAKEARILAKKTEGVLSSMVELSEIAKVIQPQAHTRHNINNVLADKVVVLIAKRLEVESSF